LPDELFLPISGDDAARWAAAHAIDGSFVAPGPRTGDMVGSYRLVEVIGEGGFGEVWLAERREPMVQRVAIKIIKPGMDSRAVIARFEQERQALAVMDHPNVARVFDGGVTAAGTPAS
jgi:serine/threonine protein kinase